MVKYGLEGGNYSLWAQVNDPDASADPAQPIRVVHGQEHCRAAIRILFGLKESESERARARGDATSAGRLGFTGSVSAYLLSGSGQIAKTEPRRSSPCRGNKGDARTARPSSLRLVGKKMRGRREGGLRRPPAGAHAERLSRPRPSGDLGTAAGRHCFGRSGHACGPRDAPQVVSTMAPRSNFRGRLVSESVPTEREPARAVPVVDLRPEVRDKR